MIGVLRMVGAAALILTATIAPLFVFGSIVRDTFEREVAARTAEDRQLAARLAGDSIDREIRAVGAILEFAATAPSLRSAMIDDDKSVLDARLMNLLEGRRNALGAILDPSGKVLSAPLAPALVGQDFATRDYFRGAMSSSDPYVSEVFTSASPGSPTVVAVSYAARSASIPIGVVVITMLPADVLAPLEPLRNLAGRDLLLVDAYGKVVVSTDRTFQPLQAIDLPPGATMPDATIALAGRERVVTAAPVAGARWTLYVLDDPAVVLSAQRALLGDLNRAGLAVLAVAVVVSAAVVALYTTTARQRDELRASRAALARTNEALQSASRAKSDFLAGMSHELRTPLNAILGFSDLLVEQLGPLMTERQSRYLRNIKEAGSHLLGLINDVLDLSKVEAGRVELRPERSTVGEIVKPLLASTSAQAQARDIAFEGHIPEECAVHVDAVRLRQILYNLLSNAVKFTVRGRVVLRIVAHGSDLEVEVADTGIGIPASMRDRVFTTFERLHEGRFDASGTGLGLALTKRLVELQGGTILFTSVEGEGTTFHVRLPNVVVLETGGERVLVVEDDPRDAELVTALAARVGLESEVVRTPDEALDAVHRSSPVAVVLDLRLAAERGERVLEELRSQPATSGIPVIVVTVEDDEGRSVALGADAHLTKPIRPGALTEHLARALRDRRR